MGEIDIELTCSHCFKTSVVYSLGGGDPVFIMAQQAKEIERLRAEVAEADESAEALHEKIKSLSAHETCGCSYDRRGDICMHHSPKLAAAITRAEKAEAALRLIEGLCERPTVYDPLAIRAIIKKALAQKEPDGA